MNVYFRIQSIILAASTIVMHPGCGSGTSLVLPGQHSLKVTKDNSSIPHSGDAQGESAPPPADTEPTAEPLPAPIAAEPVAVGGTYLVCLKEKGPSALCRLEDQDGNHVSQPMDWIVSFHAEAGDKLFQLAMEDSANPEYLWRVTLEKFKFEQLVLQVRDTDDQGITMMRPITLTQTEDRMETTRDPRKGR